MIGIGCYLIQLGYEAHIKEDREIIGTIILEKVKKKNLHDTYIASVHIREERT